MNAQPRETLFLCTPVLAEMRFGVELLASGQRKTRFQDAIDHIEDELYRDRILVFDAAAALEYGRLAARRQAMGRRMGQLDAMIAAIAMVHGAKLATRDASDFADLGLDLINPFEAPIT
jgi:predicted nucleic acid-binding protein